MLWIILAVLLAIGALYFFVSALYTRIRYHGKIDTWNITSYSALCFASSVWCLILKLS